jgi:hypothetical protein
MLAPNPFPLEISHTYSFSSLGSNINALGELYWTPSGVIILLMVSTSECFSEGKNVFIFDYFLHIVNVPS